MMSYHRLPILTACVSLPLQRPIFPLHSALTRMQVMATMYVRPQLFFNCTLCPTRAKESLYSASHKEVSLVYFSTFEPINLTPDSIMQQAGVPMLYDSASNQRLPCLYICPVENVPVLGLAPLIPCFIGSNSHPTIPHCFALEAPPPTLSGTGAMAAGSTR